MIHDSASTPENIKVFFEHLVVAQKRNKRPVPNKRPPLVV